MKSNQKITLNGVEVRTRQTDYGEFLCLTDLAKVAGDHTGEILSNWLRLIGTIEFLKEFEVKFNENFDLEQYKIIRANAGTVRFRLSAKQWISKAKAIGIISEQGRFGGTYAHNAIALEFCSVISPAFKLGVFVDYLTLKEQATQNLFNTYEFFLEKIEDNTLEANQLAKTIREITESSKKKK